MSDVKQMSLAELLPEEGIKALMEAMREATANETPTADGFHKAIVGVLEKYKDSLLEKGVDHEYLAYAIEANLLRTARPKHQAGMRVRVHDGSGEKLLGEGTYEGDVSVYFIVMPDGSLRSLSNAEEEPPPEMVPEGGEVVKTDDNPKIRLDTGEVVYGCQVWWEPI